MKYQSLIDLHNKNNSHTLAFDQIMSHAEGRQLKILEVGCASGYFGSILRNHDHEVWGIEPDKTAASNASLILDHVHNGTIEDFFNTHPKVKFDAIVFGDVLEHLIDPVAILEKCKQHLHTHGIIVASIPNVAHGAIRLMLLEGRWDYAELGILDRTHLHFYTKDTIIELFEGTGYTIECMDTVSLSISQVNDMQALNLNPQSIETLSQNLLDTHAFAFQYVISARQSTSKTKAQSHFKRIDGLKIACIVSDTNSIVFNIRLRRQLQCWASITGGEFCFLKFSELNSENMDWGDIYVFQREANDLVANTIISLKKCGKKIIFDIDDYLFDVPDHLSHHRSYIEKNLSTLEIILSNVDAVSTSTENLRKNISQYNHQTFITPNYSEYTGCTAKHPDSSPEKTHIIVSASDALSIDTVTKALAKLQNQFNIKIIAIGPFIDKLRQANLKFESFDATDITQFRKIISSYPNPIGLIPLDSSTFSSCKSAVKYFDYSMCNIPSICSDVSPYSDVVKNGIDGILLGNSEDEWFNAILELASSAQTRMKLAAAAKEKVTKHHNLRVSANAWQLMIESIHPSNPSDTKKTNQSPPWLIRSLNETRKKLKNTEEFARECENKCENIINEMRTSHAQHLKESHAQHLKECERIENSFINSTSWRVTAPLRTLSSFTKKLLKIDQ